MSQFYKLSVKKIQHETDKCVTISFNVPEKLKDAFKFTAGQYLTLNAMINGEEIRRDYSICSAPKSGELTVAVKEVENGTFSKFANRLLKVNDVLEVAPPNGRFIFKPNGDKSRTIVAFAAGSGITPIMSIAKTILTQEPKSTFMLIYGNKTPKDTIFFKEILDLHHEYLDRFNLQLVFSQSDEENALFGRIEKSTVNFILKNKYKHISIDQFYICGPEQMIHTVQD
ncbi:MAG: flavodoxin reductase, partial [Bacteroidia bacterium]|nr:flavodoxin reductase [Bacteroidia bacterium]